VIYLSNKTGVTGKDRVAEIKSLIDNKTPLRYGAKAPDAGELRNILAYDLLGLNVQTILGLARGEARQALLRGELEINDETAAGMAELAATYVKNGDIITMFSLGYLDGDKIARDPLFPDLMSVPEMYEAVHGKPPEGPLFNAYKSFLNIGVTASKGIMLPKDTPDDIQQAYIAAVKQALDDPEFQKVGKEIVGEYPHVFGDDAAAVIKESVDFDPETLTWFRGYMKEKFNFSF